MTTAPATSSRRPAHVPPVAEAALVSLVLVVCSTIYLAAATGHDRSLVPPFVLVVGATLAFLASLVLLARARTFAWHTFRVVAQWALLAYVVIGGMIALVFLIDDVPGRQLALLLAGITLFVLDVTVTLAFGVARYQPAD